MCSKSSARSRHVAVRRQGDRAPVAKIAARIMAGRDAEGFKLKPQNFAPGRRQTHRFKEAVFRFARFWPASYTRLGPEMKFVPGEFLGIAPTTTTSPSSKAIFGGRAPRLRKPGIKKQKTRVFFSFTDADKRASWRRHPPETPHPPSLPPGWDSRYWRPRNPSSNLAEQCFALPRSTGGRKASPIVVDASKNAKFSGFNPTEGHGAADAFLWARSPLA